jgi:hypothetical protein
MHPRGSATRARVSQSMQIMHVLIWRRPVFLFMLLPPLIVGLYLLVMMSFVN